MNKLKIKSIASFSVIVMILVCLGVSYKYYKGLMDNDINNMLTITENSRELTKKNEVTEKIEKIKKVFIDKKSKGIELTKEDINILNNLYICKEEYKIAYKSDDFNKVEEIHQKLNILVNKLEIE